MWLMLWIMLRLYECPCNYCLLWTANKTIPEAFLSGDDIYNVYLNKVCWNWRAGCKRVELKPESDLPGSLSNKERESELRGHLALSPCLRL